MFLECISLNFDPRMAYFRLKYPTLVVVVKLAKSDFTIRHRELVGECSRTNNFQMGQLMLLALIVGYD